MVADLMRMTLIAKLHETMAESKKMMKFLEKSEHYVVFFDFIKLDYTKL